MKKQIDLVKDPVEKIFIGYLLPSVSATMVTSIYVLADTIMIGKGLGADAIAALNILLPLFSLFFGTGLLFGVGGSVLLSFCFGKGEKLEGNRYFTMAVLCTSLIAVLYVLLGTVLFYPIVTALGATETTLSYIEGYGKVLIIGIPCFMFSSFLQAFVRNDKAPKHAMIAVIAGGVLNIVLDYIFIFILPYGMKGAAAASVLGSFTTCIILFMHFFGKKNNLKIVKEKLKISYASTILKNGFSSFLVEMSSGIIILFFNIQLLKYAGDIGITVYTIISNTAIIVMSLSNGVSQAAQPIIAMNYGAGKKERIAKVRRIAGITAFFVGLSITLLGILFPKTVIEIFLKPTEQIMELAPRAILIYFCSFSGLAWNNFYSNYFQAILKPAGALIICFARGILFSGLLVYLLPMFLKLDGIWLTMPITELLTCVIVWRMLKRENN